MYQIIDLGKEISVKYDLNITRKLVHSQPAYIEHQKNFKRKAPLMRKSQKTKLLN